MEENVVGFIRGKECVSTLQQPLDSATALNMWNLIVCLEPDNLHCHLQPHSVIVFGFVTTLVLDCQTHIF